MRQNVGEDLSTNLNTMRDFDCRNWGNPWKIPARNQTEIRTRGDFKKCL